jgi:porphobilinogen synthase
MLKRPRRNRRTQAIRSLMQEHHLRKEDLVMPVFIAEGAKEKVELAAMPGIYRYSLDTLIEDLADLHKRGLQAAALFPCYPHNVKDPSGSLALVEKGLIPQALTLIKKELPSLCVIADVALDPYTSHGHDGLIGQDMSVLNDPTVAILKEAALLYARYGADYVAPSDMMDGRVRAIREHLDRHGLQETGIIAYTAKYASAFYGPFRQTLGSTLAFGDKKGYQMNPANVREALIEAALDEEEGADVLMVKPASLYLDVIKELKSRSSLPICAYHVSGEYAMVKAAEEKGLIDAKKAFLETLLSIKRAGADFIFSYATPFIIDEL